MRIALFGFGTVGQGVYRLLSEDHPKLPKPAEIAAILVKDLHKSRSIKPREGLLTDHAEHILDDPSIEVIIEATGDVDQAYVYLKQALSRGKHVISANKALISAHYDELNALAQEHHVHLLFEAAVGGGIPVLAPLRQIAPLNRIESMRGIVNGSTNFVLSELSRGQSLQQVLKQARAEGYLEADPTDDLCGYDARRKLVILIRLALGFPVREQDILCLGIERISDEDIRQLRKHDRAVKLLASASCEGDQCQFSVQPWALSQQDPLASVSGAYNQIEVVGNRVGELHFYGKGAGMFPTANAMLSDLHEIMITQPDVQQPMPASYAMNEDHAMPYYVRSSNGPIQEILKEKFDASGRIGLSRALRPAEVKQLNDLHKDWTFIAWS